MNPVYLEDHLHTRREQLLREAATDRLLRAAHPGSPAAHDALLARLGDVLLACGLRLKRRSTPAGAFALDVASQASSVITHRIGEKFWRQPVGVRPAFGFHLLRYDGVPTIGLMYWRLDRPGAYRPNAAPDGDYAAITWIAAATPSRQV